MYQMPRHILIQATRNTRRDEGCISSLSPHISFRKATRRWKSCYRDAVIGFFTPRVNKTHLLRKSTLKLWYSTSISTGNWKMSKNIDFWTLLDRSKIRGRPSHGWKHVDFFRVVQRLLMIFLSLSLSLSLLHIIITYDKPYDSLGRHCK